MVVALAASSLRPLASVCSRVAIWSIERARTAGAGAVHALLDAVVKVDDLGVLAAQLDGDIGGRNEGLDGTLAGDDLLDKLQVEPLGQQQAARAR